MACYLSNPIPILNGDNFKHTISFVQIVNGVKSPFPLSDINMTATYSTDGGVKQFIATKTGQGVSNCILDESNQIIKVIFENYDLDNGCISCKLDFSLADEDYPDGKQNVTKVVNINVNLLDYDQFILQNESCCNKTQVTYQIKTQVVIRKLIGNQSAYDITYNYIYS